MAQYDFDVSQAPAGVCPPKLAREIKAALALARKPKIIYRGTNFPGTDNLQSGQFTVVCRVLTAPEQATLLATIQAHNPCAGVSEADKPDVGLELDDLEDVFATSMPGTIVYVRDLPRLGGATNGCHVYRSRNGWRRLSDDTVVNP
jgi:hypothetical protein